MTEAEAARLIGLAELAIGLAGFSAIVVLFKRDDSGGWLATHADRFVGMVVHAMAAAGFCVVPQIVDVFVSSAQAVWTISSFLLAVQIGSHLILIGLMTSTPRITTLIIVGGGGAVVALLAANCLGWGFDAEFGPYLVGVSWHLVHAAVLFVGLVWIPAREIEGR